MQKRKRSEHYVNNKEFLEAIVKYKNDVAEAAEKGEPKPRITMIVMSGVGFSKC